MSNFLRVDEPPADRAGARDRRIDGEQRSASSTRELVSQIAIGHDGSMQPVALDEQRSLRPIASSDVDELWALVCANREHLAPWMPWAADARREATQMYVTTALEQAVRSDGVQLAITQRGRIVGTIGFHYVSRIQRATSIGYWLDARAQGRGTVTLAVARLLDHAFGVWRLHRVEIRAAVENARSRAIPERLGFVQEGVMRDAERFDDRYLDLVVYSQLEHEWRARRSGPGSGKR
jgi:ribosomal-protein-serine acetyltransferase